VEKVLSGKEAKRRGLFGDEEEACFERRRGRLDCQTRDGTEIFDRF
jgi:hypothetical protein